MSVRQSVRVSRLRQGGPLGARTIAVDVPKSCIPRAQLSGPSDLYAETATLIAKDQRPLCPSAHGDNPSSSSAFLTLARSIMRSKCFCTFAGRPVFSRAAAHHET